LHHVDTFTECEKSILAWAFCNSNGNRVKHFRSALNDVDVPVSNRVKGPWIDNVRVHFIV